MRYRALERACRAKDGTIAYPGYQQFFTRKTLELVSRIYARDIAEFDYPPPPCADSRSELARAGIGIAP